MPNYFATYGTFRRQARRPATPVLRHLRHLGDCVIPGRMYQVANYPVLKPGDGSVKGDLIELPWLFDFAVLDQYEDYYPAKPWECHYVRRRIRLIEPRVEAWVYLYSWPVDRNTFVRSGDWLQALDAGLRVRRSRDDRLPAWKYLPPGWPAHRRRKPGSTPRPVSRPV